MPLLFDMPMKQLKTYKGRNPRPADFDAFWDRGLDDMSALDPRVEMKPAAFKTPFADCFHLFFTGVDGSRVHAKLLQPKKSMVLYPDFGHEGLPGQPDRIFQFLSKL